MIPNSGNTKINLNFVYKFKSCIKKWKYEPKTVLKFPKIKETFNIPDTGWESPKQGQKIEKGLNQADWQPQIDFHKKEITANL